MKGNITNCFLLQADLLLFCCCPLEAEVNQCTELALALGNTYRNSGWRINTQISLLHNFLPNTTGCPGVGPAVDQLDVSAFKIQLLNQNAHLCKKEEGGKPRRN